MAVASKSAGLDSPPAENQVSNRASSAWADKQASSLQKHMFFNVLVLGATYTQRLDVFMSLSKFQGDISKVTVHGSILTAISSTLEFLLNPFLGKLSDAVGRKPLMAAGPVANLVLKFLVYSRPTEAALNAEKVIANALSVCSGTTMIQASFADIYEGDTNRSAHAFRKVGAYVGVGLIAGPMLGVAAQKAMGGPRNAFLAAALVAGLQLRNLAHLDEPLAIEKRSSFNVAGANPMSFLRLLYEKRPLLIMSFVTGVMQNIGEGKNIADVHQSLMVADIRMGDTARSAFVSFMGLVSIGGAILSKVLYDKLGGPLFTSFTLYLSAIAFAWLSTVPIWLKQSWPMFIGCLMSCFTATSSMYTKTVSSQLATAASWGQGEFQGALANMRALTSAVVPFALAKIYAWSKANGRSRPGLAYQMVACANLVTDLTFRSVSAESLAASTA